MQREYRMITRGGRRVLALGAALALAVAGSGTASATPSNSVAGAEWALNYLNTTQIRNVGAHGQGVVVAVIDSGVDSMQPDLQGRLIDGVNLTDPNNPMQNYSDLSSESHGTSVATIIAGYPHDDGNYGMIGLADAAKIMPIEAGGSAPSAGSIAAGILYAVNHGAQVINISIANAISSADVTSAINTALADGVVVVVGTGNDADSGNQPNTMATVPGVLDVAGIDSNGQKYSSGHFGPDVDVASPANAIEVGLTGGRYSTNSGTSFAAPWVSGEAALLIAEHPTWTSGQIVASIIDNTMQVAEHVSTSGQRVDDNVGYGVIDPVAALGAAEPSSTANPLGGPAITSNPAENVKQSSSGSASASAGASAGAPGATSTNGTSPVASAKSSSKIPLIIGIVVVVVVLLALLVFLLSRRNRGGRSGPGGGGGGGGTNGYYPPPNPPGGQYVVPPQQHNPYQAPGPNNPYTQPQPQPQPGAPGAPGAYPPPPQAGGEHGGDGGQQQNPYSGR